MAETQAEIPPLNEEAPSTSQNEHAPAKEEPARAEEDEKKTPPVEPDPAPVDESIYQVKWVRGSGGAPQAVVTQNENGPCPLLAIVNVLLARGQIALPPQAELVSSSQLMARLGDCILRLAPKDMAESLREDYEANVSEAVAILAQLSTGIDVNVKFTGVKAFEYTKECIVFDLLGIPLYHGWLVDAESEAEIASLLGNRSYNQVVESVVAAGSEASAQQLEAWLAATASQLTYPGLCELHATLRDGELGVLFRNNHFSTLLKNRDELFTLVTDQGFLEEPRVVWETLASVDGGDSHFVDAAFHSFAAPASPTDAAPPPQPLHSTKQIDSDYELALSLQAKDRGSGPSSRPSLPGLERASPEPGWDAKHPAQSPLGPGALLPDELLAWELQKSDVNDVEEEEAAVASQRRPSSAQASAGSSAQRSPKEDKIIGARSITGWINGNPNPATMPNFSPID